MKTSLRSLTLATALCAGLAFCTAAAEKSAKDGDKPEHVHQHLGGPNGGRLLETEPHAEFLIEKDRSVTIRFFSDDLKPVAATGEVTFNDHASRNMPHIQKSCFARHCHEQIGRAHV